MKNLIRNSTTTNAGELERGNSNPLMHCGEFDPPQMHDRQHRHNPQSGACFASKSELASGLEHQQRLFSCASGSNMLPMATRSFGCSQLGSLADYPSETIKPQHQCKSEKHDDDSNQLSGKCQMHSTTEAGADILVKSEFNEMQQSKSSPVHEVFEMTSNTFASSVAGSSTTGGNSTGNPNNQFHHDTGSPPLPLMDTTNPSASHQHHHHHHQQLQHHQHQSHNQHQQAQQQHQCSTHSYESYVYGSGNSGRGVEMSPRHLSGTMNTPPGGSALSGGLYHCKSFFADSASGSGNSGIASFYPNSQHQANSESCRDDSSGYANRDALEADEKVVIAIKARKMSD